jgi:leader peptidase (prepilin peptidase)/N-methyltransferase
MVLEWTGLGLPFVVGAVMLGLAVGTPLALVAGRVLREPRRLGWRVNLGASIAAGMLFGLLAARFAAPLELAAYLVFAASAVVLTIVDLIEKRLPNVVVLPSAGAVFAFLLLAALLDGSWPSAIGLLAGGAGLFAVYFVLAIISPRSMGMGDVKLAIAVGAASGYLGLTTWLVALLGGFLVGSVVSLIGLASRRLGLKSLVPFGPSMLAGAFIAVFIR